MRIGNLPFVTVVSREILIVLGSTRGLVSVLGEITATGSAAIFGVEIGLATTVAVGVFFTTGGGVTTGETTGVIGANGMPYSATTTVSLPLLTKSLEFANPNPTS